MKYTQLTIHTTYGSGAWDEKFTQVVLFRPGETENKVVNLYPEQMYHTFDGFGGAITDSAAYVYSLMDEKQKQELMTAYFSPDRMNYQGVRIPIDSCDFSLEQYEASGKPDLSDWSFERVERYILPMLRDAEKAAGRKLPIMLSPWSPPAYMKDNGCRDHGGRLLDQYRAMWAEYLCRYIKEYKNRGFLVTRISLQNEPKAVQTWDSCIFTAQEQKTFLRDFMWPAMEKHGITDVEIYIWDHNKERVYEWLRDVIDEETDRMIAGAAFHWYSGDHFEALDLCRQFYPDKKLMISESCIEFYKFDPKDAFSAAKSFSHEMIGDLNHGISYFGDWNLLLDENGGPNYVHNYCLAPFLFDTRSKQLKPQLLQQYMEHFSHGIVPGAVRIAHTNYTEQIDVTAWKRPDGTITVIFLNKSAENKPVCIRMDGSEADMILYPQSITTCVIS